MTTKKLYEQAVHQYCEKFCDLMWDDSRVYDTDDWVSGDIGGIICIADYWFNFSTIKEVVDKKIDKDTVFEWYDYNLNGGDINLHNYWKGVRDEDIKKKENNIEDLINANSSVSFDARVEEIMEKIYSQDSWTVPEYEMIRMFIYTKLAPRDWSKKDKQIVNSADTIDDLESI